MYLCVKGINIVSSYDFSMGFGTVPTVWYFVFFILLVIYYIMFRRIPMTDITSKSLMISVGYYL